MQQWLKAVCVKCKSKFSYRPVRTTTGKPVLRHICDECRDTRKSWLNKRWKAQVVTPVRKRKATEARAKPLEYESRNKIAKAMGLDPSTVEMIERQALSKIRDSPEMMDTFHHYVEAGMPRLKELVGAMHDGSLRDGHQGGGTAPDLGAELLEYQLQVADWWQVYERLKDEARELLAPPPDRPPGLADTPLWRQSDALQKLSVLGELEEILQQIARFQKALAKKICQT